LRQNLFILIEMKKIFTKLFTVVLSVALSLGSFAVSAQQTSLTGGAAAVSQTATVSTYTKTEAQPAAEVKGEAKADAKIEKKAAAVADTSFKPVRRLWGYAFGDFYYNAHADATNRGPETMYNGVPTYRNAFQFRRLYIGYDYDITRKFTAEVLLASEPNANTGVNGTTNIQNGDNLVDNKMSFFIKNFNLRYRNLWEGTDFVIGELSTPGFALNEPGTNAPTSLSEATWGFRSIEKTVTDFHKTNSYDVGAALQGTFDPATKNFGYVVMLGNNTGASLLSATNANTGFYKIVYADIWGKFFNKQIYLDIYTDYVKTAPATAALGPQSHNIWKAFAAYVNPKITVGVEAYTQQIANGVTNTVTKTPEDATVQGLSVWVKGAIVKNKLGFFARYDGYNPDTDFNSADSYGANTNFSSYNPTVKEKFYTAGLDFTPAPKIHFMPNIWLVDYKDQRDPSTTGYVAPDHTLVYRFTFFYTFGK
jgi:hypothetical protein